MIRAGVSILKNYLTMVKSRFHQLSLYLRNNGTDSDNPYLIF